MIMSKAPAPLRIATKVCADQITDVAEQRDGLVRFTADKGIFDVLLEASGNERALRGAPAASSCRWAWAAR